MRNFVFRVYAVKERVYIDTFTQAKQYWNFVKTGSTMIFQTAPCAINSNKKVHVQVGKDQEKAQSEKDSHSKHRGGEKQT